MSNNPLYVSFVWHMHQPYYKDPVNGSYRLPWVRLHGSKDYLDMMEILRDFPAIRQNFNFVPSLLEQIIDYTEHGASDTFLDVTRRNASQLREEEKIFMLENFFLAHWENMIRPFPRYDELLAKRGTHPVKDDLVQTSKYFSDRDWLDLQVLFTLSWIDPLYRQNDPFLRTLVEKGRGFTEEEKHIVVAKQMEILGRIIPVARELSSSGQVELSFSPFYHPILPLLCDTEIAKVSMPGIRLPSRRFSYPDDAAKQISMGRDYFEKIFGFSPQGMWPSEGSVSEEVIGIAAAHGIKWAATDEGILSNSLKRALRDSSGNLTEPAVLYRPYRFKDVSIIFRDRELSDLIGFVYSRWEAKKAADDLIRRLIEKKKALPGRHPHLVPIILDGENAWEHYRNDGRDFLLFLYEGISKDERLRSVTVSEFLETHPGGENLDRLFPGSWIYSNYGIWIGHEEDNLAWDYLTEAREALENVSRKNPPADLGKAWKSLYIAEGSDWNWWYGDEHTTETQKEFDELFRFNLMNVFREMGTEVPARFHEPVLREDRGVQPTLSVRGFIDPKIDGIVTSYYEWYQGAQLDVKKSGGSMHKADSLISTINFGFNKDCLFIRLDPVVPFESFEVSDISLMFLRPSKIRIICALKKDKREGELSEEVEQNWQHVKMIPDVAVKDIFEIRIPFSDLHAKAGDEIQFFISIRRGTEEIERCPWRGFVRVTVPTEDFEAMLWY